MGGQEGSRGYLYQAIAAVLNSLREKDWKYVQVEPNSQNDKIDILWEYENGLKKATQVKSSINNISKANIINWLEELIKDAVNIEEVSLLLIGSCNDSTKKFINQLNRRDIDSLINELDHLKLSNTLNSYLGKIEIQFENFNQDSLESVAHRELEKFLSRNGHTVKYKVREMILSSAFYHFFGLSKDGGKMSREEFEQQILEWVYSHYPEVREEGVNTNNLVVQFYLGNRVNFTSRMNNFNLKYFKNSQVVNSQKGNLLKLIDEIRAVNLESSNSVNKEDEITNNRLKQSEAAQFFFSTYNHSEIPDNQQRNVIKRSYELLGVELNKEFFNVGNLKVVTPGGINSLLYVEGAQPKIEGTENEQKKNNLILEFVEELDRAEALINFFNYIGEFCVLPLVLRNEGETFNEDIKVTLKFPREVEVVTEKSFEAPNNSFLIKELAGPNGFFDSILRHKTDSKVEENVGFRQSVEMSMYALEMCDLYKGTVRTLEDLKSDFLSYISSFLGAKIFNERGFTILKYNFNKLSASESISFPSYILVRANSSFQVDYEVTSKNLKSKTKGNLFYNI
ncbi:hypothetical protein [Priestia aryabhattai]